MYSCNIYTIHDPATANVRAIIGIILFMRMRLVTKRSALLFRNIQRISSVYALPPPPLVSGLITYVTLSSLKSKKRSRAFVLG